MHSSGGSIIHCFPMKTAIHQTFAYNIRLYSLFNCIHCYNYDTPTGLQLFHPFGVPIINYLFLLQLCHPFGATTMTPLRGFHYILSIPSTAMTPLRGYNYFTPSGFPFLINFTTITLCHPFGATTILPLRG